MKRIAVLALLTLAGCAGSQSKTMIGGNLFAQWRPTRAMLAEDATLVPIRWTHAESMQLGSYVSGVWMQEGESPPMLVVGSLTTQAGPVNAALGAGGLIGAAVLFNPDSDTTAVSQEGGGAESNSSSKSKSKSASKSDSKSKASTKQSQGQAQGQQQNQRQKQGQLQGQQQQQKRIFNPQKHDG